MNSKPIPANDSPAGSSDRKGSGPAAGPQTRPFGFANRFTGKFVQEGGPWHQNKSTIESTLRSLCSRSPIEELVLFAKDGTLVAKTAPKALDCTISHQLASAVVSLDHTQEQLELGHLDELILRSKQGTSVIQYVGLGVFVMAIAPSTARLGTILLDLGDASGQVREIVGETTVRPRVT